MRRTRLLAIALAAALGLGPAAEAKDIDALAAEATRGARSDAERAAKLLAAARLSTGDPAAMVALLERALACGIKGARRPSGLAAAAEALAMLEEKVPDRQDEWRKQRVAVCRLQYRYAPRAAKADAGDKLLRALRDAANAAERDGRWADAKELWRQAYSVAYALRSPLREVLAFARGRATHFETIALQADRAAKALAGGSANGAMRQKLLEMLVIELDRPAEARKHLTPETDQTWRTYLPLAQQEPAKLSGSAAAELGRWYHEYLAPRASKFSQLRVLLAAKACYQRAVKPRPADETVRLSRLAKLGVLEKELEELAMHSGAGGRAPELDLLGSLDLAELDSKGAWDFVSGALTVWPARQAYARLPATVSGSYRLSIRFANRFRVPIPDKFRRYGRLRVSDKRKEWLARKINETRGLDVALPVGRHNLAVSLEPTSDQTLVKLLYVEPGDDTPAARPVTRPASGPTTGQAARDDILVAQSAFLPTERIHQLDIAVLVERGIASVAVDLNHKRVVRWKGETSQCSLGDPWPPGDLRGAIVLGGWTGPTAFLSAKVCSLSGQVRLLRHEKTEP
jgi:hypothetical protein